MNLKEKTFQGMTWSFIENSSRHVITFVVGIILARLLSPREFGLIGMIIIFIAISKLLVDSGFNQALIRKKNCTQTDYSTIFYFNIIASIFLYSLLFIFSESIARFFDEPKLKLIVQILGIVIIINSLTIIQKTQLVKSLDFKLLTKVSIIASTMSGITGITLASTGFGVWSLVVKTLADATITTFLLFLWNKWKPSFFFSKNSFKELFSFGSKLLLARLINTIYRNIYYFIIGKFYSAKELGFFTKADRFRNVASENIYFVINRVSYPVLASIQNDTKKLKQSYRKLLKSSMLITFFLLMGLAAVSKAMILTLIGRQWLQSVIYLQLLCFVGIMYPLYALNLNILKVLGRSDLCLNLEIIRNLFAIPMIIIGIFWGIKIMIIGLIISSILAFLLNSHWSGKFIGYSLYEQLKDIFPAFLLSLIANSLVFLFGKSVGARPSIVLILQIIFAGIIYFIILEIFRFKDYLYLKTILFDQINKIR